MGDVEATWTGLEYYCIFVGGSFPWNPEMGREEGEPGSWRSGAEGYSTCTLQVHNSREPKSFKYKLGLENI